MRVALAVTFTALLAGLSLQLQAQLKLDDLGWAHTVSTGTFMRSIGQYYDEMAGVRP